LLVTIPSGAGTACAANRGQQHLAEPTFKIRADRRAPHSLHHFAVSVRDQSK